MRTAHAGRWRAPSANGEGSDEILTTLTGLRFPEHVDFDVWERAGHRIARIANSSAWYLGDWLVYGQTRYDDRYRRVVELVGLDYQTLRNYAWVARNVEYPRRRADLSFQHHAEITAFSPAEQVRWLDLAARNGWSRNELRKNIKDSRVGPAAPRSHPLPRVNADRLEVERWQRAAAEANTEFPMWIVTMLNEAAERVLRHGAGPSEA
ncbi:LmbU family transcriptional regulator [Actinosynnema pretiosum subsp. pretiosum]|uniref:LmbU family transcriptional regulator n=1 Tax=Actinosynnema pretiosum subsp. pretiosum TaxID=103721 RepID=A0AA45LDV7_9PSEU|nr:LmbU family transcriptional regulator [Actinosynnema pretiosum subsp. pretiosum]